MFMGKNQSQSSEEQHTHFSSQVQLGREIQETLKDIRASIKADPTGFFYSVMIDNFETTLSPYIKLDYTRNKGNSFISQVRGYILNMKEELKEVTKNSEIRDEEVAHIILNNPDYRLRLAQKKHKEIMNLLARFSLLPIPMINDMVEANEFEQFDESAEA